MTAQHWLKYSNYCIISIEYTETLHMKKNLKVAYFSMEIGIRSEMPTYAGGLGMLAGDIMRSCADMGLNGSTGT